MAESISFSTLDEARAYAADNGLKYLVLSPETLAQIESAEAAGGFEGGMSGASGSGGYSTSGTFADHSDASESPVPELDLDGAVRVGAFFDWGVETILSLKDAFEAFEGLSHPGIIKYGPILLVPKKELDRWLFGSSDDA